jgi:hypothetical protein
MKKFLTIFIFGTIAIAILLTPGKEALAISGSDFKAGRIIDDAIFTYKDSMSVSQIQTFLNSKMPSCDRWRASSNPNYQPPYTCLNEYQENVSTGESNYGRFNSNGTPLQISGGKSAAQIIWEAGQKYAINPQVLIVLLQKEQSLVTDNWPWLIQYQKATGYLCPDTSPCDPSKAGFYRQIDGAAWQFRHDFNGIDTPGYWAPYGKGWNNIRYSPESWCGTKLVYIENQATAVLYKYTPYTPDQAALNNLYGTGDACSAYGNRNFWRIFSDWFGSTQVINAPINLSKGLTLSKTDLMIGESVSASYEINNNANYDIYAGGFGICARLNGEWFDFGFSPNRTISANSSIAISFSRQLTQSGNLQVYICSYNASMGGWLNDLYPYNSQLGVVRNMSINIKDNPLITSGISISPTQPSIGQPVTATMKITNSSPNPVPIGLMVIAARIYGYNVDFSPDPNVIIGANSTYTYSKTQTFYTPGNYTFFISNFRNNVWSNHYPKSADNLANKSMSINIKDNPLITSGISISPTQPSIGQPVTATMKITNSSPNPVPIGLMVIAARIYGYNVDFSPDPNVIIGANSTYTYSKTQTFYTPGNYTFFISNFRNNVWNNNYPVPLDGSIVRKTILNVGY